MPPVNIVMPPMAAVEPEIVGRVQIQDDQDTKASSYAYIIEKPAGWSIVGAVDKKKKTDSYRWQ